jgi:hypothetical protein
MVCSSVDEDVTEATMLQCHDIGFTCVVTAVPWNAVVCGRKLFHASLKICEVPTVNVHLNVVARTIIGTACKHDVAQRRHNQVEITCLYMIILVSSVPMYGEFKGLL